jgi:hypothetical protein
LADALIARLGAEYEGIELLIWDGASNRRDGYPVNRPLQADDGDIGKAIPASGRIGKPSVPENPSGTFAFQRFEPHDDSVGWHVARGWRGQPKVIADDVRACDQDIGPDQKGGSR